MNGVTLVAIVEREAYGLRAYHAKCLTCGWRCTQDHYAHARQAVAVRHGEAHVCGTVE